MPIANTFTRFTAQGLREDLTDVIYDISPQATPFSSAIARVTANQTLFEWQTDELESVDADNARREGFDATFAAISPTKRVGNYTQISSKEIILSDTLEVVDKAGRQSELAYQIMKRGAELRRDMEAIQLANQAGDPGNFGGPRRLAGLPAWLQTNVDIPDGALTGADGDGANSGHSAGVPLNPRVDDGGDGRAITDAALDAVVLSMFENGGDPKLLMLHPRVRRAASRNLEGIVDRSYDLSSVKPTAVVSSADVYVSDFGTMRIVPNRFQRQRDGWVLDPSFLATAFLRPVRTEELAKTGDAHKRMMVVEYTLQVRNEAALGLVADLSDLTP